jgi:branched-chain amino acid transport system substrate-binding protein
MKTYLKILLTLILSFPAYVYSDTNNSKVLKVGVILPLSGAIAEYGVASKNGFELAKVDMPELFSNIEFVYEDSQYDPKTSISAYRKLRRDSEIKLIYSQGSNPSAPLIPIAERECFPLFAADFSSNTFKNINCVIAFAPTSIALGKKLIEHLSHNNINKLGILSVENLYINGIIDGIKENLQANQKIVFHESVIATDNDFKTQIAKLKKHDIDALGVLLYAGQIQNFYRNLKSQNINLKTFSSDFIESREEIKGAGDFIQGAVYPHLLISDSFYNRYREFYKDDSQITSGGSAYDFALMIAKLFNENPDFYKTHTEDLNKLKNYDGVMGKYTLENTPEYGKRIYSPIFIKRILGDFYEVIE